MNRALSFASGLVVLLMACSGDGTAADKKAEPFQASLDMNVTVFEPIFAVPPDKRAQVEFLSIRVIFTPAPNPAAGGVFLRVATTFDGELAEHSLPLIALTDQTWVASHDVLLHADPGTDLELQPTGACDGIAVTCNVRASIAGFLYKD